MYNNVRWLRRMRCVLRLEGGPGGQYTGQAISNQQYVWSN
jgi:hypothetical protein